MPKSEKTCCGVFYFPDITRWRLRLKDTRQWFVKIKQTAAFLAKMAQQRIHRHAGGTKARVHLHHNKRHIGLEHHLRYLLTVRELKAPKQKVLPPGYVYIHNPLSSPRFFNLDPYAKDRTRDKDFISDLLTDQGPSTGLYTISCVVMQLTTSL